MCGAYNIINHPFVNNLTEFFGVPNVQPKGWANCGSKAGIMLLDLTQDNIQQPDLFHHIKQNPKLMQVIDSMNQKYGKSTVRFGSEGFERQWVMRSDKKSPAYTTNWNDLIEI